MTDTKKAVAELVSSGVEHYGAGRLSEAINQWERALALDPEAREAREYLSYVRENFDSLKSQFEDGAVVPLESPSPLRQGATMMGLPLPPSPASSPGFIADIELEGADYQTAGAKETMLGTAPVDFPAAPTTTSWGERGFDTSDSEQVTSGRQAIEDFELELAPSVPVQDDGNDVEAGTFERSQMIQLPLETAASAYGEEEQGTLPRSNAIELGDLMLGTVDEEPETHDGLATSIRGDIGATSDDTIDLGGIELTDGIALPEDEQPSTLSLMEALRGEILESVSGADPGGGGDDAIRARIEALIDKAQEENRAGRGQKAVVAATLAIDEAPANVVAQKVIHARERELIQVFAGYLGSLTNVPTLAIELSDLDAGIDSRDAFLLTRVDGMLSFGDIIDISGMNSLAAHRTLCRFLVDGVIRV